MRNLLRDRVAAGLWVVLIAAALVFQGTLFAVASATMAAASANQLDVLCSSHDGTSSPDGERRGEKPFGADCATLCRLAATAAPVVLAEPPVIRVALPPIRAAAPVAFEGIAVVKPQAPGAGPRAPPFSHRP